MSNKDYYINGFSLEKIRNIYEVKVIKTIKEELNHFPEFDQCRICIEDVYALSLSRMPSTYTQPGSVILKKEISDEDIREIVRYAIFQVIQQPKHR